MPSAVPTEQVFKLGNARVYTSPTLVTGDDWVQRPYLYCDSWRDVAGPDIGGGTLRYDYGEFGNQAADLFEGRRDSGVIHQPLSILRHYVKIEVLSAEDVDEIANPVPDFVPEIEAVKTFYGRIDAVEDNSAVKDTGSTKTGTQIFTVYDLKVELADVICRTSYIEDPNEDFEDYFEIGQAIGFNMSPVGNRARHGNRKPGFIDGEKPAFVFSWVPSPDDSRESTDVALPVEWKAGEAVLYVLKFDVPKDKDGDAPVDWRLNTNIPLQWYNVTVQREGRTALDVLNELIDRRRLVGYSLECEEPDSGPFKITVRVFTFTDTEINMPGDKDLPANADTTTLVAQTTPATESIILGDLATHQAEKVRVEGDPATVTMTLRVSEATPKQLLKGWGANEQDEYVDAAGSDETENTIFRLQDKYDDVFSRIILSDYWDQKVQRPSDDDEEFHACIPVEDIPEELEDDDIEDLFAVGEESEAGPWWHRGHRFHQYLAITDAQTKQYRPMFVLFQDSEDETKYHFAEKLNAGDAYEFACHVYTLPDRPGIRLKVTRHGGQQLIASDDWNDAGAAPSELDPTVAESVNYKNTLVTVTMDWDARCFAEEVIDDTRQTLREVLIRVPGARLDIMLPGCVTDVDSTGLLVESDGEVLRDDRERLRDIAKAAAQWYGVARKAARLTYNDIIPIVNVGQFVTDLVIGATTQQINTPVTGVAYDFLGGRCFVETSYADADFT